MEKKRASIHWKGIERWVFLFLFSLKTCFSFRKWNLELCCISRHLVSLHRSVSLYFFKIVFLVVRIFLHFSNKQFTLLSRSDNLPSLSDNLRTIMSLIEGANYVNVSLEIKPHVKDKMKIGMLIVMMRRQDKDNGVDNNDNIDDLFENLIMLSRSSPFTSSTWKYIQLDPQRSTFWPTWLSRALMFPFCDMLLLSWSIFSAFGLSN